MDLKPTLVLEDIIPPSLQDELHEKVVLKPWNFVKDMSYADYDMEYPSFGFNHMIKHPSAGVVSDLYEPYCVPIINNVIERTKLEITDIYYNRAFLQVPLEQRFMKEHNGIHVDLPQDHYACVYYVNDSDGDTIIYEQTRYETPFGSQNIPLLEHKRVKPKKGMLVMFDGARYHCSSQPRDTYRCIINFDLV